MSLTTTSRTAADLLDSFLAAPPDRLAADFRALAAEVWDDGRLTDAAGPLAPELVAAFGAADPARQGYLAVLLGLLAQADAEDGTVRAEVRSGLDGFLAVWRRSPGGEPLSLALTYLLAQFPADRERILAVAADVAWDPDDRSRFERALESLDPAHPVLGRVFPSPAVWTMNEDERSFDESWIRSLTPEQVAANWKHDTSTVLGGIGAKAYWAVQHGTPAPLPPNVALPVREETAGGAEAGPELLARHADALRCPACGSGVTIADGTTRCTGCAAEYPTAQGITNFFELTGDADDLLFKLANVPSMGLFYEAYARPAFLRLCGQNWDGQVSLAYEDDYLARNVRPVDGPVLDLAAGAGRWTEVIARTVGAERLIALDMSAPMLSALRDVLPDVPAVMASGRTLPFGDATLGAAVCWNALQAFPDDAAAAIAEVGRCLRPGGTFTILTFRRPEDPIYRYFQGCHFFPQHGGGLQLLDIDDLHTWLADAGLTIRDESGPGTFVFITAERPQPADAGR